MTKPDRSKIDDLYASELQSFVEERPRSRELWERGRRSMPNGVPMSWMVAFYDHPPLFIAGGEGAYVVDVDGYRYLDTNLADISMSCGYGPEPLVRAVTEQIRKGSQFLLPTEDAIHVSENLAGRFGLPYWQYTLAASSANAEAIRLARASTGRPRVVVFDGCYHGHIDDTMDAAPITAAPAGGDPHTVKIQFNDREGLERLLKQEDVACVVAEPAMTNINVVLPAEGFHDLLRKETRRHGTVLILDETHTHVCAYGGLTRAWNLEPDILVVGKSIAGGVPMGVYGLTESLARTLERLLDIDRWPEAGTDGVRTGGTLFGNPLSMAAARATLEHLLTEEAQARAARLGAALSDGIESIVREAGLPWTAHRLYCRSGVCYAASLPGNAIEASRAADFHLNRLHRVFLANRGVWEAILSAGPCVSLAAREREIDLYLEVFQDLVKSMTA